MLHPALARTLASAHIDDLHRAAARWHTIRLAHRAAHEPRVAATSTAIQRSASESAAWTSCAPAAGMTPTETAQQPHGHANPSSTSPRGREPESIWHRDRHESFADAQAEHEDRRVRQHSYARVAALRGRRQH